MSLSAVQAIAVGRWQALRPDQRGAVIDGIAQLVERGRADLDRRVRTLGACPPDLESTYEDTGEALEQAVALLAALATTPDQEGDE